MKRDALASRRFQPGSGLFQIHAGVLFEPPQKKSLHICFLATEDTFQTMLRMLRIITILLATLVAVRAETPAEAIRAMVEAERNFFQIGQEKGTRAAFLEFLADDSI